MQSMAFEISTLAPWSVSLLTFTIFRLLDRPKCPELSKFTHGDQELSKDLVEILDREAVIGKTCLEKLVKEGFAQDMLGTIRNPIWQVFPIHKQ